MTLLRILLGWPISIIFIIGTEIRRLLLYFIFRPVKVESTVISVGNITSGGTGKTPFVNELIRVLEKLNKRVVIVSRSYKAGASSPEKVDLQRAGPEYFGDEPSLLAVKNPAVAVYVGPKKFETCREVVRKERPDVIVVDDGFQHLRLFRDFDFVLVDATEPLWHYLPLPMGYARDPIWQLKRADLLVLTKENLVSPNARGYFKFFVREHKQVVKMNYTIERLIDLETERETRLDGQKCVLVSGIGRPSTFRELVKNSLNVEVTQHLAFGDHQNYGSREVDKINMACEQTGARYVITTEKDAIKLKGQLKVKCVVAVLKVEIPGLAERVNELFT